MNNSKMVTVYVTKIKRWTEIMSKIKRKIKKTKQTSSINLTDRFPSKTPFKIIISNQLQDTPTRIPRWQSTYKIQNTTSHHCNDPLKRTRHVSPEVGTLSHRSDTHRGGKVLLHVNQKTPGRTGKQHQVPR